MPSPFSTGFQVSWPKQIDMPNISNFYNRNLDIQWPCSQACTQVLFSAPACFGSSAAAHFGLGMAIVRADSSSSESSSPLLQESGDGKVLVTPIKLKVSVTGLI